MTPATVRSGDLDVDSVFAIGGIGDGQLAGGFAKSSGDGAAGGGRGLVGQEGEEDGSAEFHGEMYFLVVVSSWFNSIEAGLGDVGWRESIGMDR